MHVLRLVGVALGGLLALTGLPATQVVAAPTHPSTVSVSGAVATPTIYTRADLAAMTQTTLPDRRRSASGAHTVTGVLVSTLITSSAPVLPDAKNADLRVTATISGARHERVAVALGELDPTFGNHPALLALSRDGRALAGAPELVFPGDRGDGRTVRRVDAIRVAVAAPTAPIGLPAGAVQVTDGRRTVTLSARRLAALPTRTRTVTFGSGKGPQQHVEVGPTLRSVLAAARVRVSPTTTVAALATDGYVATVTPAEATAGRRTLLLSLSEDGVALTQPRLVTDGDVAGGRYVTDVVALDVTGHRHC